MERRSALSRDDYFDNRAYFVLHSEDVLPPENLFNEGLRNNRGNSHSENLTREELQINPKQTGHNEQLLEPEQNLSSNRKSEKESKKRRRRRSMYQLRGEDAFSKVLFSKA